ncbi:hypothetical protein LOK49_LG15G01614 [Camellia lanceoleosa]|uniref:Uncharacterized protein n=1 Tax=Camellia lanceoleosa TaxID=1840588 RepID=A0ACC0F5R1_9ERIC|nr:hypothetical protein LOK49_LG15G01614 [Camellia lanceoleosa]
MEDKSQIQSKNTNTNENEKTNGTENDDEPDFLHVVVPNSSSDSQNDGEDEDEVAQKEDSTKIKSTNETAASSHCFPIHRISRIIKSEDPDIRIAQESVFLINKASPQLLVSEGDLIFFRLRIPYQSCHQPRHDKDETWNGYSTLALPKLPGLDTVGWLLRHMKWVHKDVVLSLEYDREVESTGDV